MISSTLSHQLH